MDVTVREEIYEVHVFELKARGIRVAGQVTKGGGSISVHASSSASAARSRVEALLSSLPSANGRGGNRDFTYFFSKPLPANIIDRLVSAIRGPRG